MNTPDPVLRMAILQNPNAREARADYIRLRELEKIDDQAICNLLEEAVLDSIVSDNDSVTIEAELAEAVLLVLKTAIRRSRGGQHLSRHETLRKRTLISWARERRAALIADGMKATEAHLEAADEIAREAERRGIGISASYLAREMERRDHRH